MNKIIFVETQDDKGINLKISYNGKNYLVEVFKDKEILSQEVMCSFTPTFGMDILDQNQCLIVAEKLALQLEKKLGI
jgi:hypothetical protein